MPYSLNVRFTLGLLFTSLLLPVARAEDSLVSPTAPGAVAISADFPGGNIQVESNKEELVKVAPDLRGDRPWFYWYFEATALRPGRVTFVFPEKVAGFTNGGIGNQGPAISLDQGQSWRWLGTETVRENTFYYDFAKEGDRVRFAVTIPYLPADLAAFLQAHAENPHLTESVLTKSRRGREVTLLRIGQEQEGRQKVLVTGRHHAAETMASYVLEGFLAEAMSASAAGEAFRNRYVLHAVPLVDTDGVAAGDQGKNRQPHDHNRDYSDESIYPEVQAIMKLGVEEPFQFALDFHCPTLVMPDHQVMYFVGAKEHPAHNLENVSMFAKRIKSGLPEHAPVGPLVWLRDEDDRAPKNSRYFAIQEGAIMSATFEFPFAPPGKATDPESCRRYGKVMLEAFVDTHFLGAETE